MFSRNLEPDSSAKVESRGAADSGHTASLFVAYAALGFGVALIILFVTLTMVWYFRRRRAVARMRQAAASAYKVPPFSYKNPPLPFLVVHPAGDTMVAFQEMEETLEEGKGSGLTKGEGSSVKAFHMAVMN